MAACGRDCSPYKLGIADLNDGSTYVEHNLEFCGDIIFNPGNIEEHVQT